jgi:DNA-binding transcriptional ArsR family regulator
MHLLANPAATFRSLLGVVTVSKSTLSFHMRRLVEAGLVLEDRDGREKRYQVERGERAAELLTRMRGSLMDDAVDSFVESWMRL